jgi:hypothetical protein
MSRRTVAACLGVLLVLGAGPARAEDPPLARANALWEDYVFCGHEFEPRLAELYADTALIRNTRRYPKETRVVEIPVEDYKMLVAKSMPVAKARGDVNDFSDVTFTPEGDGYRIRARRYSRLKKYESPLELLVRPAGDGRWLIFEEISESRP